MNFESINFYFFFSLKKIKKLTTYVSGDKISYNIGLLTAKLIEISDTQTVGKLRLLYMNIKYL